MTTGRCLCGACRFTFDPAAIKWQANCHCESCRRATGGPWVGWIGVRVAGFAWTGAAPAQFASSPGVTRRFCPTCGAPLTFESTRWPDEIHVLATQLDNPESYAPTAHVYWNEHLSWGTPADDLPRETADD